MDNRGRRGARGIGRLAVRKRTGEGRGRSGSEARWQRSGGEVYVAAASTLRTVVWSFRVPALFRRSFIDQTLLADTTAPLAASQQGPFHFLWVFKAFCAVSSNSSGQADAARPFASGVAFPF